MQTTLAFAACLAVITGVVHSVLIGTRGRHPGWVALSMVAALTWVAAGSVFA